MQLVHVLLRKHPYVCIFLIWVYTFLTFGRFQVDDVSTFNYIAVLFFAVVMLLAEKRYVQKKTENPEERERDFRKTAIMVGVVGGYTLLTQFVFSRIPYSVGLIGRNPLVIPAAMFLFLAGTAVYLSIRKKWSCRAVYIMIFLAALSLHICYMLYSGLIYQRDLGDLNSSGDGHLGYIEYLYYHVLPAPIDPRTKWQYYHPPLNHYLAALILRIQTLCGLKLHIAVYNITYMPLLYYMFTVYIVFKMAAESGLRKVSLAVFEAIIVFTPALTIIGGYVNNDMLSLMFAMLAFYEALCWYKKRTFKNILKVGFSFGLGMFTKLSVWMMALPIAVFFLAAWFGELKKKNKKEFWCLTKQMAAFLGVSVPLSFYWSIRNLLWFGVPIGYIPVSGDDKQLIFNPVSQRLFDFSLWQLDIPWVTCIRTDPYNEYNPLIGLIKSSNLTTRHFVTLDRISLWITIVVCITAFICMIGCLVKKKSLPPLLKLSYVIMYAVNMISYYIFCIRFPHICTQEMRYCEPVVILGALFLGLAVQLLLGTKKRLSKAAAYGLIAVTVIYCLCSAVMVVVDSICFMNGY